MALVRASEVSGKNKSKGGDGGVRRDDEGRPRLLTYCWLCDGSGRRPSPTGIEGRTVKCQGCNGTGIREKSYARVTSFIDVLEDKKFVVAWKERMVLLGCAEDPSFLDGALKIDKDSREGKDALNRRAMAAQERAGANDKSEKGDHLHTASEAVDRHEEPQGLSDDDAADMAAYAAGTHPFFKIHRIEQLVVNEDLGTAGTPDRVSSWCGAGELIAPDGTVIRPDELLITDLKTGRVDFGTLKMAMQLAIYSRSKLNVNDSPDRADPGPINQKWGVIMHLPAGSGKLDLYWADLELGWEAVQVARNVRAMRKQEKKALTPLILAAIA